MAKFRSFDSYSFDFAAFDVDPFGPIDPDTEAWTDKTVQFGRGRQRPNNRKIGLINNAASAIR